MWTGGHVGIWVVFPDLINLIQIRCHICLSLDVHFEIVMGHVQYRLLSALVRIFIVNLVRKAFHHLGLTLVRLLIDLLILLTLHKI